MNNKKQKEDSINITVSVHETPTYQLSFLWTCPVCNYKVYNEFNFEDNDPNDEDIQDTLECFDFTTCHKCNTSYTLEIENNKNQKLYKLK
jgi:hypothetical protein